MDANKILIGNKDESEYTLHTDYDKILLEVSKLQGVDEESIKKVSSFVTSLKDLTLKIQPVLEIEIHSRFEKELWNSYEQLQRDKLLLLDLSHEWGF